jgi:putative transposase
MKLQRWVSFLLIMLLEYYQAKRCAQIQFMKLQIEFLWDRLDQNRVVLTPEERVRMLRAGAEMDHDIKDVLEIVAVKTYKKWIREEKAGRQVGRVGRPKILASIREVIIRLAKENVRWGLRGIVGELRKLALRPGRSTVRRVLIEEGVLPDPYRHAPKGVVTPWRSFIKGQMESMIACDFFSKAIWTPFGKKMACVLAFIHLGSRKVFVSPATEHPTEEWMLQQSRNVHMWAEEQGIDLRFLIHDHDGKFPESFDKTFEREGGKGVKGGVIKTPVLCPIANCFAENWIGSLKRECLNHFVCVSLDHLDYIVGAYVKYFNTVRPHQGLGNVPIPERGKKEHIPENTEPIGKIGCQEWLGGVLKHYYRKAA